MKNNELGSEKHFLHVLPVVIYRKPKFFRKNYMIVGEPFKVVGENPKRLTKEEIETERYLIQLNKFTYNFTLCFFILPAIFLYYQRFVQNTKPVSRTPLLNLLQNY